MRIVSLLASATEMIAELGCLDQLVGRSHECDFPPSVQELPLVSQVQIDVSGSSVAIDAQIKELAHAQAHLQNNALRALSIYTLDTALLQQLQPDLIVTQTQCEVCAVSERDVSLALAQVAGISPRILSLAPYRLEDVWEDMVRVGKALERIELAQERVQGYQQRLAHLRQATGALQERRGVPRVAVLEWLDPLMGAGNWTPELVASAGGTIIFGEVGIHSSWITEQELREANPDVLILSPCGYPLSRTQTDISLLQQRPFWQHLQAVQRGRVFAIDGNAYLNRSGPRLVQSAELLARCIWGDELDIAVDQQAWMPVR